MSMFTTPFKTDKIKNQPRSTPSISGRTKQIWHMYIMEFYSVIKSKMSFAGKRMEIDTIRLNRLRYAYSYAQIKQDMKVEYGLYGVKKGFYLLIYFSGFFLRQSFSI